MNNKLGVVLALILCIVVGISVYFWQENRISSLLNENKQLKENIEDVKILPKTTEDKKANSKETSQTLTTDDFKYDEENYDYYGKLIVNGYATLQERPEAFCEENCPVYTYVFFNILDTENKFLDAYIKGQKGNSFVGETSIGLGCVADNILWRMNDSNEFGMQKYTNSLKTSEVVLNSSTEKPITIELERYLYSGGRGAPDCYSHFAQVKIVE
jgi:hypothetical protein